MSPRAWFRSASCILRGNILILFLTWVILGFGNNMVHKFDGLYFSALGASDIMLGYMSAITFGMMALLQIPGGHLADTLGRKRVIVIFTFVMAFSMLIFVFAPSWQYIVLGLIISNIALLYQPALFSIIMDSLPDGHRAEGFAITNLSAIPSLAAPLVGGLLIQYYGLIPGMRLGYFILFLVSLTAAFMRLTLKETVKVAVKEERESFRSLFSVIKKLNPKAKGIIITGMLISSSTGMVAYFVVKYAYTYTSTFMFGVMMALMMLVSSIIGVVVGHIGDTRGKEKFYIAGALLYALSISVFTVPSIYFLAAYAVISGIGMAMVQPSANALIADLVSRENRGRFTGVYLFMEYMAAMLTSVFGGFIYMHSPQLLFVISAVLSLAGAFFAMHVFFSKKNHGHS